MADGSTASEQLLLEAAARLRGLLCSFPAVSIGGSAEAADLQAFARRVLTELVRWLEDGGRTCPPAAAAPCGNPRGQRRRRELAGRLARAQGQLEQFWKDIARNAAALFAARFAGLEPKDMRTSYGLVIECAEEAYGAVARTQEYARAQAELINTLAALRVQWRGDTPVTQKTAPVVGRVEMQEAGCSAREAVWRKDRVVLYRYLPLPSVKPARSEPLLISYALVNRPYVLDLQPDRSLIRSLLAAGLEVYLIDWGYPEAEDRALGLSDYVDRYLGGCVRHILRTSRRGALNLAGVCQGGTLGLCYCARNPEWIANLILLGTPVDFRTEDNLLSSWARDLDARLLARTGNVSGVSLIALFLALSPFRLTHQKYLTMMDQVADADALELFGRMERWIFDSPDLAARAFSQFLRWFYQENRLIGGTLAFGGRPVELRRIRQPVLNIYATRDHIVPPSASKALRHYVGSGDYTEYPVEAGHIGLYVSSRAQPNVPARIASWLEERARDG